jgi:8-oxo-dGTP diphosphatase
MTNLDTSFDGLDRPFRQASRALVVDPDDQILLVRFQFADVGTVWATPGGGIEFGESPLQTVRRELREEVGLTDPDIGPVLWDVTRHIDTMRPRWRGQRDLIHLVRSEMLHELRWWTVDELIESELRFAPYVLPQLVAEWLAGHGADLATPRLIEEHL